MILNGISIFFQTAGNSTKVEKIAALSFGEKRFKVSYLSAVKVSPTQRSRSQSSQTAVSAQTSSICLDISWSPEEEEGQTCHERAFLTNLSEVGPRAKSARRRSRPASEVGPGSKLDISPYLFNHQYGFQQP